MGVLAWEELLGSGGQVGDGRWARLVPGRGAEVEREVRELGENPPGGVFVGVVRGERSRGEADLFEEWGRSLGFPDWFGRNWDAFNDSFADLVEREREGDDSTWTLGMPDLIIVLVLRSSELLRDDPQRLETLVEIMRSLAFGLAWEDKDRPRLAELRVLFQCEPGEAKASKERLARAGVDWGERLGGRAEGEPS